MVRATRLLLGGLLLAAPFPPGAQEAPLPPAAVQELTVGVRALWGGESGVPPSPARARALFRALAARVRELQGAGRDPLRAVTAWWTVARGARTFRGRVPSGGGYVQPPRAGYRLWVPGGYRPDVPAPLVVCLHPGRLTAREYLERFWLRVGLRDQALLYAPEWREGGRPAWERPDALARLFAPVGERILLAYNVDRNRVFLDAAGDAGPAAWRVAAAAAPLLAGLILRAAPPPEALPYRNLRRVPLLFFPAADMWGPEPLTAARRREEFRAEVFAAELTFVGRRPPDPTAGVGGLPGVALPPQIDTAHLERAAARMAAAVRDFLARTRRDPYPPAIDWTVLGPRSRRAYWVRSLGEEYAYEERARPYFRVRLHRRRNAVEITTHLIRGLEVRLNDRLLDLDRPVTIRVDGRRLFYGQPRRSLAVLLRGLQRSGDWTDVFPWRVRLDVPVR